MIFARTIVAATAALPLLAGPAFAQSPAPAAAPAYQTEVHIQKRIDALRAKLKITPAQESAFQAFATQMQTNAATMHQAYETRRASAQSMTAVENVKTYADLTEAHAQEARSLIAPFQSLYAQLSPDQQKTADTIFRQQTERAGHGRHG